MSASHRIVTQAALTAEERQVDAICTQVDPEVFFPQDDPLGRDAKRVCMGCPLRAAHLGGNDRCLEVALANNEQYGVFGGLTGPERARLRAKREEKKAKREKEAA